MKVILLLYPIKIEILDVAFVCFFLSSEFYFDTPDRNSSVVGLYLTWQMAGERRSFRLSLSVRWSIPVPIVSLPFSPLGANEKIIWIVAWCALIPQILDFFFKKSILSLSIKVDILLFSPPQFLNKRRMDGSRRRRWIDVRAHEPVALMWSWWGGLIRFQELVTFSILPVIVRG